MENNAPQKSNGKAVASLVLGIIAVVTLFFGTFAWIGIICGIVGLVLGSMARKENPCGMATAGFVLSLIAVILCAITFIACLACVGAVNSALGSMY